MDNTIENHDKAEDKRVKRNKIWTIVFVFLFAVIAYSGLIWALIDGRKDISSTSSKLLSEQKLNSTCTFKRDSLTKEVKQLSIYKSLTKAMVHRDEATSLLKYKVGDIVCLKADSSRAVVSDIVIGGSQYEYYIKYKVLFSDKTTEEINPDLVY